MIKVKEVKSSDSSWRIYCLLECFFSDNIPLSNTFPDENWTNILDVSSPARQQTVPSPRYRDYREVNWCWKQFIHRISNQGDRESSVQGLQRSEAKGGHPLMKIIWRPHYSLLQLVISEKIKHIVHCARILLPLLSSIESLSVIRATFIPGEMFWWFSRQGRLKDITQT